MIVKESKKMSKIVDELFLYFIKHGHTKINLNVEIKEEYTKIDITVDEVDQKLLDKLTERISDSREIEIEQYGWELMGESQSSNELEIIGLLIDTFKHEKVNNKTVLTFIRKRTK